MALSENKVVVQNFTGGLITDFHELNTPQNVTVDELNCDLNRKGFRQRRLGMWYESGYVQNAATASVATMATNYIGKYDWNDVNNNANLNFLVVQTGNTLSFYDKSYSPISGGLLTGTINLDTYKAPAVTSTADTGLSVASGNGFLFVAGAKINPFYIQYTSAGAFTVVPITIQIRDLAEQDTTLANDARPATVTDARLYDLYNQGWNQGNMSCYYDSVGPYLHIGVSGNQKTTVIQYYVQTEKVYPPKTAPWWVGKRIGDKGVEVFDPVQYDTVVSGNTLSALGHFIVNAFAKDRATASGIPSMGVEITDGRPTAVAFYSGRVFWACGNTVYFSQVFTDDISAVGKCYQEADPTAEQISDLLATDGGTIMIPQSSNPIAFFQVENSLLLFTTNGLWLLSGESINSGFSATNFSVTRISDIPCVSARTIINVEGMPLWWAPQGICTIAPISTKQGFEVKNITMKKIQNLYDAILPIAKQNATGAYDRIRKRCVWAYQGTGTASSTTNRFYYNNLLILDLLFDAFIPYTISDLANSQPSKIVDVFNIQPVVLSTSTSNVVDAAGVNVTDQYTNQVTSSTTTFSNSGSVLSDIKYLVCGPVPVAAPTGTSPMSISFGDFIGTDLHDWTDDGVAGANYTSYLNTAYTIPGYMSPQFTPAYDAMLWMYSPYVYVFLENQSQVVVPGSTLGCTDALAVTSPSIMAYIGGGTVGAFDNVSAMPDWHNNRLYLYRSGATGGTNGISSFDLNTTGSPVLERTIDSIGGVTNIGAASGGAICLTYDKQIVFINGTNNSETVTDLDATTLAFQNKFGVQSASLVQSTSSRILEPASFAPIRFGTKGAIIEGSQVSNEVNLLTEPTVTNTFLGTVDESRALVGAGAVHQSFGTAFILGVATNASYGSNTNTAALGLYKAIYSAAGCTFSKVGTVTMAQIDATWAWLSQAQGVAYDQTDGNPIIAVGTTGVGTNKAYFIKLNATNASIIWKCPVTSISAYGSFNMGRHNISNQTLFHLSEDATAKLYTINTSTGVATNVTLDHMTVTGAQISDDCSNSIVFYGSWTQATTVPTYLGAYMGTGAVHTFTNKWGRWFVGTSAGQVRNTPTAATGPNLTNTSSCLLQTAWDWSSASASHKWAQQIETYKYRANFFVNTSKNKVRGKGKTMQLRFSSTEGKDFQLLGWGIWYAKNQHP